MKLGYVALCLAMVSGSAALVGCSGASTDQQAPQTSQSALGKAPVGVNTRGPVRFIGEALGEVALRPEQRVEIEKLAQEADARHATVAADRKALMLAFADQIEKGAIDKAALQPKLDQIRADEEKIAPSDRDAFVKLHGILDSEQRNAFVDAMEARFKAKHDHHGPGGHHKGAPAAEGAADKAAPEGERPQGPGGDRPMMRRFGGGEMRGGFFAFGKDLDLTEAQQSQIKEAMKSLHEGGPQPGERPEHRPGDKGERGQPFGGKNPLEAFRADTLDAQSLTPPAGREGPRGMFQERMTQMAEKIVPILTPAQRKTAADKMRGFAEKAEAPRGN